MLKLARAWIVVSTQSVGGGPSTLYLMRQELVERHAWLTHREFLEDWALSKLSLGINLIAMAALIGRRIAGGRGMVVSMAALLLPASAITLAMTVGYTFVRGEELVRAALAGAGPVTAGMTIGLAYVFAQQAVRRGWRGAIDWLFALAVFAVGLSNSVAPILLISSGIVVGVAVLRGERRRASPDPGM